MTAAQIITMALQIAKVPGYTSQGLIMLNAILLELSQDYDFEVIRKSAYFNFNTSAAGNGYAVASGPNVMPEDFIRLHRNGSFYYISQVPYTLIGVKQEEFDSFVQQAGLQSYPYLAYVDVTEITGQEPGLYVWPPASGAYPCTIRYNARQPDITDTTATPWFPSSSYLITRLAAEMMPFSGDDRADGFLAKAEIQLKKYLNMKDDPETAPKRVLLDRKFFGQNTAALKNTKQIGW